MFKKKLSFLVIVFMLFSVVLVAQEKKYVSYTIQQGETLKSIAKKFKIKKRNLKKLNPDVGRNPVMSTVIIVPNLNYNKGRAVIAPNANFGYHVSKPKETLYSIGKMYANSERELLRLNPYLKNGLKIGQAIKYNKRSIPVDEVTAVVSSIDTDKYHVYTIVKGDNFFNLKQRFGLTKEQLISVNPSLVEGVKLGQLIIVGEKDNVLVPGVIEEQGFLMHTVVKGDTFFNLKQRYSVSDDELLGLNPTLTEGVKLGMELKIRELSEISNVFFNESNILKTQLNVALMLPFNVNQDILFDGKGKSSKILNIATDYYMGAKIAIDSLRQKGVFVNLNVFDTENSTLKIQQIASQYNFDETDVVIGPLFLSNAHNLAKRINAPVVAPMYSSKYQNTLNATNLIKAASDKKMLEDAMVNYIKQHYNGENIIVIGDNSTNTQSTIWRVVKELKTLDNVVDVSVVRPEEEGYIKKDKILSRISKDKNNWIVLLGNQYLTLGDAVNTVAAIPVEDDEKEPKVRLFAVSKNKGFDRVDNNALGKLSFTFASSEYIDIVTKNTNDFVRKYRAQNHAMPTKYAMRGFDVTYDVLMRLACAGSLEEGLTAGRSSRLSTAFEYTKKFMSGYQNKGVNIIQFNRELKPHVVF
ncbi:MAG: LysM peptidoglycan-binding domain-containing protein [Flavobacteriaceae bacterium]|nr:LysM peptidoglycan-binding domain-containing protein [Flavobacteriaceae bacterium]